MKCVADFIVYNYFTKNVKDWSTELSAEGSKTHSVWAAISKKHARTEEDSSSLLLSLIFIYQFL